MVCFNRHTGTALKRDLNCVSVSCYHGPFA